MSKDFVYRQLIPMPLSSWALCGKTIEVAIETKLHVDNSKNQTGNGIIAADALDANFMSYHGSWSLPCALHL
jgi:hypothetical protein